MCCWNLSKTWTQTLERELHATSVVNLGLDGTGTDVHLAILKEYLSEHQPEMVILDEPFSGMDQTKAGAVRLAIESMASSCAFVVITGHRSQGLSFVTRVFELG